MDFLTETYDEKNKGLVLKLFETLNAQGKIKEKIILTQIYVTRKKYLKGQIIELSSQRMTDPRHTKIR